MVTIKIVLTFLGTVATVTVLKYLVLQTLGKGRVNNPNHRKVKEEMGKETDLLLRVKIIKGLVLMGVGLQEAQAQADKLVEEIQGQAQAQVQEQPQEHPQAQDQAQVREQPQEHPQAQDQAQVQVKAEALPKRRKPKKVVEKPTS
jgi:flagellar biosynthesis GTPase FlhF